MPIALVLFRFALLWRWRMRIGTGVADDKAIYAFVPRSFAIPGAKSPSLAQVQTYYGKRCQTDLLLKHLPELVG